MMRSEQWLMFICALRALSGSERLLRVCVDSYFPKEEDWETLPAIFPYVEKLGLLVHDHVAANYYRNMCRDNCWDKVVPVVQNYDSTDSYNIVINRW
jgi:hypothetical protein